MRYQTIWSENLTVKEKEPVCIRDLCFSPDGRQLLVAANHDIHIFGAADGLLINSLKEHRDVVTSIAYSTDGKRFATASADKLCIIWTNKLEGVLKFSHSDVVRCVVYNPVTHQLVSGSSLDFGMWSLKQKSVSKIKISNAINCAAWSDDGQFLALGLVSGAISIRGQNGEEKFRIDKGSGVPIWSLTFRFDALNQGHNLITMDFEQRMKCYQFENKSELLNQYIGYDAQFIQSLHNYDFLMTGGSNRQINLYTKDGILLGPVCDKQTGWIRKAMLNRADERQIAFCTQDGNLALVSIEFDLVYSVHRERYAFRERMTDVVIQQLRTGEKIRIKCHEPVKNLALCRNRFVVSSDKKSKLIKLINF